MFTGKCCGHSYNIFDFNRKYCSGVFIYEQVEHILLACCAVFHKVRTWLMIYEANIHYLNYHGSKWLSISDNDWSHFLFFFFLLSEIACLFLKLLSLLPSMWISIQFDKFHADFCWYSDWKCMNLKISLERNDILIITYYPLFWLVQSHILSILFIDFELLLEFFLIIFS